MNDNLDTLLRFYGRTIARSCISKTEYSAIQDVLETARVGIATYMDTANVASNCAMNALFYWAEQPFLFSSFPVQRRFLSIARARSREGHRGETWRHKGYIYSEDVVVSHSCIREYFARELSYVDSRDGEPFKRVKFITFRDGRFDCSPADLDEAVFSSEVEWLWFVWDSFASITDEIREAISSSSLGRVHKHYTCQIVTADRTVADYDLSDLISDGWQKVPYSLLIPKSPTTQLSERSSADAPDSLSL